MLRGTRLLVCILLGLTSIVSGCVPEYKTEKAQQCTNQKMDSDETDVDCGGGCNPCGLSKACKLDADCSTSTCISGHCYDPSCRDSLLNNAETDLDCGGGLCPACGANKHCAQTSDCLDGRPCLDGVCYAPQCNDGKHNNAETDVDCGGDQCPACPTLKGCKQSSDCKVNHVCLDKITRSVIENGKDECGDAGICASSGICYASTCKNGNLDGTETDTDCGGEACPPCVVGKGCAQNSDCDTGSVCLNRLCYIASCVDGKQDGTETDKDCGGTQCPVCTKGKACASASDCEATTPCTAGKCGDPQCFDKQQQLTETDLDCGGTCAPCSLNKKCVKHSDCETLNCNNGACAPPSCADKSKNQGESDQDCGDSTNLCPRCPVGATCTVNANCDSKHCLGGYCVPVTCDDGIINGKETATDCGGGCPKRCPDDSPCNQPTDCTSNVCKGGLCKAPTCSDGVSNGLETGSDCGGPCLQIAPSQTCPDGEGCNSNADCAHGYCASGICQLPICANSKLDPLTETDIDCGGNCLPCDDNLICAADTDCKSKVCDSKKCAPAACSDRALNGNETDLNCGGVTCTQRCSTGQRCKANSDCQSKVCDPQDGKCLAPTCVDQQMNGSETGPDCGGSCALQSPPRTCGAGLGCAKDDDCASYNCCTAASCKDSINTCVAPVCNDGKKNQGESGIDCGGDAATTGCSVRCPADQGCQLETDCESGVCDPEKKTCAAPTCEDGVKNGTEMGKDCGSAACSKPCPDGTPCSGPGDCTSHVCTLDAANAVTCASSKCDDGVQNGTETAPDCGGANCAKRCGLGQACFVQADCDSVIANIDCINFKCLVPSCKDNAIGTGETDVDCGGSCDKCADLKKCKLDTDCTSNHCVDDGTGTLRCAVPTCDDQRQNQGESGIDCGGTSVCAKCDTGFGCTQKSDCISLVCGSDNLCAAPTCRDQAQNQQETDLDCGGPYCRGETLGCDTGKQCSVNADCKEFWCTTQTGVTGTVCLQPSCTDGKPNGTETDVDCGGTCSTKCADTKDCIKDGDCANGWCNIGKCATPACTDGTRNGTETGPDCGGNCSASCAANYDSNCRQCSDNESCGQDTDCKSLNCVGSVCTVSTGNTPRECVGRVLDGTTCNRCDATSSPQDCKDELWCMYVNNCDPGTFVNNAYRYNACADGARNGPCSVNVLHKPSTALEAALRAYRCACP